MNEKDACYRHLAIGDVIEYINGLPAATHRDAVNVIDSATAHAVDLHLTLKERTRSRTLSPCMRCLKRFLPQKSELVRWRHTSSRFHHDNDRWVQGHSPEPTSPEPTSPEPTSPEPISDTVQVL